MRSAASGLSRGAVCAVALMGWMYSLQTAAANEDAAHALAEKFSRAAEEGERAAEAKKAEARVKAEAEAKKRAEAAKRKAAEQRAADEAEMLRSAQEEAEARRREQLAREQQQRIEDERRAARAEAQRLAEEAQKQRAEIERQAEEQRRAEAARLTREVEEQRLAEEKRLADERRIAAEKAEAERKAEEARRVEARRRAEEARVAEERRKAEEARIAEVKRQAEEAEAKRKAEEARVAELKRQAEEAEAKRRAEEARLAEQQRMEEARLAQQRAALERQREEEARRIAERFRHAREARERNKETRNSLGGPMAERALPSPFIDEPVTAPATYPQRVTALVIMQPRRHGFAGKRLTANPILCVGEYCYVSNGPTAPATIMRRAQALGPGNTLGRNAGVCRHQTTCVFRGITLPSPMTTMQPVDMGFLRHDRREVRTIEPDRSCDVSAGELSCSAPVVSTRYRAWIVPEAVADAAGARVLERALDDGLPAARSASYGGWDPSVHALPTR